MQLDNIDAIKSLRDQRSRVYQVIALMRSGTSAHLTVMHDGEVYETFDLLSPPLVRGAIVMAAQQELDVIEDRLRGLGVTLPAKEAEPEQTVEGLNKELQLTLRDLDMYRNAWARELGPHMGRKRHLIDALVVGTERMREKADKFIAGPTVPKADHDARVTELLQFNNKTEERAREAERKLKKFMNGTPAERLAFAVEQAAAATISAIKQEDTKC